MILILINLFIITKFKEYKRKITRNHIYLNNYFIIFIIYFKIMQNKNYLFKNK